MYVRTYVRTYVCMYIRMYACMHACAYLFALSDAFCVLVYAYACMCPFTYVFMHACIRHVQPSVKAATFRDFCTSIGLRRGSVKTNILIARAPPDSDEQYWLARAMRDPFQTSEDSTIGDDVIDKGTWVVPIEWYNLVQVNERGVRTYARGNRNEWPLVVRSLIAVSNRNYVSFDSVSSGAGSAGQYTLTLAMHETILKYGNWESGWVGE